MASFRSVLLSLLGVSFLVPQLYAADKAKLAASLKSAVEHSSLDSSGLRPWHMALEVTLFDKDGKNPESATVEIWAADSNMKTIESVAGTQVTTVRHNGTLFRTTGQAPELVRLELLVEQILHPIPAEFL